MEWGLPSTGKSDRKAFAGFPIGIQRAPEATLPTSWQWARLYIAEWLITSNKLPHHIWRPSSSSLVWRPTSSVCPWMMTSASSSRELRLDAQCFTLSSPAFSCSYSYHLPVKSRIIRDSRDQIGNYQGMQGSKRKSGIVGIKSELSGIEGKIVFKQD